MRWAIQSFGDRNTAGLAPPIYGTRELGCALTVEPALFVRLELQYIGVLTTSNMDILIQYAQDWIKRTYANLLLEISRAYPNVK